jgi:hypothetical protein
MACRAAWFVLNDRTPTKTLRCERRSCASGSDWCENRLMHNKAPAPKTNAMANTHAMGLMRLLRLDIMFSLKLEVARQ